MPVTSRAVVLTAAVVVSGALTALGGGAVAHTARPAKSRRPPLPRAGTWHLKVTTANGIVVTGSGSFTVTKRGGVDRVRAHLTAATNNGSQICPAASVRMLGPTLQSERPNAAVPIVWIPVYKAWEVAVAVTGEGRTSVQPQTIILNEGSFVVNHKRFQENKPEMLQIRFGAGKALGSLSYDNGNCTMGFTAKRPG